MDQPLPAIPPRPHRRAGRFGSFSLLLGLASLGAVAVAVAAGVTGAVLLAPASSRTGATQVNPFVFALGPNYPSDSAENAVALAVVAPSAVSVSGTVYGSNGSLARYSLDVLVVQANRSTASPWHLTLSTAVALVGSGVNAAFAFACTQPMTGVAPPNPPVSTGTDSHGDPWRIVAPTCAGVERSLSLTLVAPGVAIPVGSPIGGGTVLYLSFAVAVEDTGAGIGTPGTLTLVATSP
jgi:hypothetical protein